ncbi:MAG: hypothetical protein J1E06_08660 [Acutalibacter sp.]|nr:hypothetical protein [Acutalibacter sp.]
MKENNSISEFIKQMFFDYSNSMYLCVSGERDYESVRGTELWKLWYGREGLTMSTMEAEYYAYRRGEYTAEQFYRQLKDLEQNLSREFKKIEKRGTLQ